MVFVKTPPALFHYQSDGGVTSEDNVFHVTDDHTTLDQHPAATASSGFTDCFTVLYQFQLNSFYNGRNAGWTTDRMTSSISDKLKPASERAWRTGVFVTFYKGHESQIINFARSSHFQVKGQLGSLRWWLIWVEVTPERSFLRFSGITFKRSAICYWSRPPFLSWILQPSWSDDFWSRTTEFIILVANTSKTPSPNSRIDASNVQGRVPRFFLLLHIGLIKPQKTQGCCCWFSWRTNTTWAAILPASLVAWRCASLKSSWNFDSTFVTFHQGKRFQCWRIMAEISCDCTVCETFSEMRLKIW